MSNSNIKHSRVSTFWYATFMLWPFLLAHIVDDVRHGQENLFLFFIVPFIVLAVSVSTGVTRLLWSSKPALVPKLATPHKTAKSMIVGVSISLLCSAAWAKSPLFPAISDSCKIIVMIFLSGINLSVIHQISGRTGVLLSFISAVVAGSASFLTLLGCALLFNSGEHVLGFTLHLISISAPYVVTVALYDCYRRIVNHTGQK